MIIISGIIVVIGAVIGGYLMANGNLFILLQPAEFFIIIGVAIGIYIIGAPSNSFKLLFSNIVQALRGKKYGKNDYIQLLSLLHEIFIIIRTKGLREIESHIVNPHKSSLFKQYPRILRDQIALIFIVDIIRNIVSTTLSAHELESLLDNQLESVNEESLQTAKSVSDMADSLPAIGIVAAVLGIVITMQKLDQPPAILGHSIGAALVGTFIGILLSYGFLAPVGRKLEELASEERSYLDTIRVSFVSLTGGAHFKVATEFGRMVIPPKNRPSFNELEKVLKKKLS